MSSPVQCPTCRFNVPDVWILKPDPQKPGRQVHERRCDNHISGFPNVNACYAYQREPGADDT